MPSSQSATAPIDMMHAIATIHRAGFDPQLLIVVLVALVAAAYSLRAFLKQFRQSDDESEGCAACPAAELGAGRPADSSPPASPAATNPESPARNAGTSSARR